MTYRSRCWAVRREVSKVTKKLPYTTEKENRGIATYLDLEINGSSRLVPYHHVIDVYQEADELIIEYSKGVVTIKGKNLKPIYKALHRQKLLSISQNEKHDIEDEWETFVESIKIDLNR